MHHAHTHVRARRFIAGLGDPCKAGQYSSVLKALQEEQRLLTDIEATLNEIRAASSSGAASSMASAAAGRGASLVRGAHAARAVPQRLSMLLLLLLGRSFCNCCVLLQLDDPFKAPSSVDDGYGAAASVSSSCKPLSLAAALWAAPAASGAVGTAAAGRRMHGATAAAVAIADAAGTACPAPAPHCVHACCSHHAARAQRQHDSDPDVWQPPARAGPRGAARPRPAVSTMAAAATEREGHQPRQQQEAAAASITGSAAAAAYHAL